MTTRGSASSEVELTFHDPEELRRRRMRAGLTQQQLARMAGITGPHMCNIEGGKTNASPPVLQRITAALGCSIADIERKPTSS